MKFKKCAQCGCIKPEGAFKGKYKRKDGTYYRNKYCRQCELDTNSYLSLQRDNLTESEKKLQADFTALFQLLERQGLSTPLSRGGEPQRRSVTCDPAVHIAKMQELYAADTEPASMVPAIVNATESIDTLDVTEVPEVLKAWLEGTFDKWYEDKLVPDYLNDVVYPALKVECRPETGWDKVRMVPVYDDTYKDLLNKISDRFWEYDDWYREKNTEE